MRRFKLDKLVRDKVFKDMQKLGQKVEYRVLGDEELLQSLKAKLLEEAAEFDSSSPKALEELSDLLEIAEQLAAAFGYTYDDLRATQIKKRQKAGGFADRIFVESVIVKDDDPWLDYYVKNPDRFPEIT